jgi:hypothetical protein
METWRKIWRTAIAKRLGTDALRVLQTALLKDDPRLLQGNTCSPVALDALSGCAVEGACIIGFAGWQTLGLKTVGEVSDYFHKVCDACEVDGDEAACRYFLNYWDDAPRIEARRELLAEIRLALAV